jgi:hypothetical protein
MSATKCSLPTLIIALSTVLLSAIITALVNIPPHLECQLHKAVNGEERWFNAIESVAKPWQGWHQVYARFSIPSQYRYDHLYTATLLIDGIAEWFSVGSTEKIGDVIVGSGDSAYYIKQVYLPTRTALWFLITGRFGYLRSPCYWWLVIVDRAR